MKIDIDSITFDEVEKMVGKENKKGKKLEASPSYFHSKNGSVLIDYFKAKGLKIIDLRDKGGCLWILGDKSKIGHFVDEAMRTYHITGGYSSGRATGNKPAWWTKSSL